MFHMWLKKVSFTSIALLTLFGVYDVYIHNLCFKMVLRMINQLQMVKPNHQHYQDRTLQIRSLVEFRYMIEPHNMDNIEMLGRHYIQNRINLSGLLITLQKMMVYKFNLYIDENLKQTHVHTHTKIQILRLYKISFIAIW